MRGDLASIPVESIGHIAAIQVHQWTPRTTATGGKQTWRGARHDTVKRAPAQREPSKTRRYIIEALTDTPTGMTCTAICAAKRLNVKPCQIMLAKMMKAGDIHVKGTEFNRFAKPVRIYALGAVK